MPCLHENVMLDVLSSERDIQQKKISLYNSQYKSIETSVLFRTRLEKKDVY